MELEKLTEESAISISIQKIALEINDKMKIYNATKDNKIKLQLIELVKDRDLVYSNDKDTIQKYLNGGSK